jgi:OOP family OmpA-OmpF porin
MKTKTTPGSLALAAIAILASQAASAAEPFINPDWADSAWYIGAGGGRGRANVDELRIAAALRNGGPFDARVNTSERANAYKIFIGKQLNHNFAIEGGYQNLGKYGFNSTVTPGGGLFDGYATFRAANLDLLAQLPMSERASIYARLGAQYLRSEVIFGGNRLNAVTGPKRSESSFNPHLGIGLEYKLTEALAVRGELERARVTDPISNRGHIDNMTLALVYKLGRPAARAAIVPAPAPAPEPVVVAPVVTPPPPPPPPAPKPMPRSEKATFSAHTLFDFDKSELKPEGKQALDQLLSQQAGIDLEVMVVVGHTDAIGTDDYNQALSLRRAAAVKQYLTSKGAPEQKVFTEGKGESQPVADNKSAAGRTENRRVTVEVVGTRTVK